MLVAAFAPGGRSVPAAAHADGLLTGRVKLTFRHHDCSLGFFATDSVGDQLAITAGHCAQGLHEKVLQAPRASKSGKSSRGGPIVENHDRKTD